MDTDTDIPPVSTFITRLRDTLPRSTQPTARDQQQSTFYRNLEEVLDVRRAEGLYYSIVDNAWQAGDAVDLCSGDILSLGRGAARRAAFLAELAAHPDFSTGSGGVRLMDGNHGYLEAAEREIAAFHGAGAGLLVGSAYEANVAVWTAVPRPGDVVVYDALVHASTHEGIKQSLAMDKVEFPHSDAEGFRAVLQEVLESNRLVRQGKRSILVAVESIYSMDGDVCPLQELVDVASELSSGKGNIQFVVDEAHSVGVVGPKGAGLVCELGLQEDIAVVVHSFGKAIGATGAIVLGNDVIRGVLANFARSVIFTTAPSFPFVAAIKSGYKLLEAGETEEAQEHIQDLARLFFDSLTSHPLWDAAKTRGLLRVPLADGWEDRSFLAHIIAVSTQQKYTWWLYFHLLAESFCVFPVEHPIVPAGKGRLRVILHAENTDEQVQRFVEAIFTWVEEMMEIEDGKTVETVSSAAKRVYTWMRRGNMTGYGMA
ncbi:5-aminolevulinate synthase [Pestalotiopsis sp. NC0098]|nr:5-aminolevulinate synthase [Pestalotiopsis sp. NC0098]